MVAALAEFEHFPAAVTAITALLSVTGSVFGLGWWLSGRFSRIEVAYRNSLDEHEAKDQSRHEQNLERFQRINVMVAQLGYKIQNNNNGK